MRPIASLLVMVASVALVGCAKTSTDSIAKANGVGAADSVDSAPPAGGACELLTLSEVRSVLPEATKAVSKDSLVEQGIKGCGWYVSTGDYSVLAISEWQASGPDDTPLENAKTLAMGLADPLRGDAQRAIRFEKVDGVGDDAVAIVESTDVASGIIGTGAMLTLQKNGKLVTISSSQLASRERATAIEQLAALGRAVAPRL